MNNNKEYLDETKANNHSGFEVPEHYFEELQANLNKKLSFGKKHYRLSAQKKQVIGIAASIIVLLGIALIFNQLKNTTSKTDSLATIQIDTNTKSASELADTAPINVVKSIPQSAIKSTDNIDNAIIETADELNLTDEEMLEFAEIINL